MRHKRATIAPHQTRRRKTNPMAVWVTSQRARQSAVRGRQSMRSSTTLTVVALQGKVNAKRMKLDDALTQISEIRQQMAASAVFRGYRPLTTAITAGIAVV